MKQSRTQTVSPNLNPASAPANGAGALPLRRNRIFGGGPLCKAGVIALLLGAGLLTAVGQTNQPQYRFIEITVPGPSEAVGINDLGLVTGAYVDPVTGGWTSFVLERGHLTTGIQLPGASDTILGPANIWGVESGNYGSETNQRPVFRDIRRGTFTPLPEIPGMPFNEGNGCNDLGHGVGVAYASGDINIGGNGNGMNWFWNGRNYSFFTVPGATYGATAGGVNDWDQISGYYVDGTGTPHGFVKNGSNYTTLDVPGALATLAFGINNLSVVTGLYFDASDNPHGYFWSRGQFVTVDTTIPGAVGALWIGSNDQGDLAGFFEDTNGVTHAVIALRVDGE